MLYLRTLGGLELLRHEGDTQPLLSDIKPLLLLAFVATEETPATGVFRRHVAQLFWPNSPRERALGSVRNAIRQLNKAAGEPVFHTTKGRLQVRSLDVDVLQIRKAIEAEDWISAATRYRGRFLESFDPDKLEEDAASWVALTNDGLRDLVNDPLVQAVEMLSETGRHQDAIGLARIFLSSNPLLSERAETVVGALVAAGRHREALELIGRHAAEIRHALDDELPETLVQQRERIREFLRAHRSRAGERERSRVHAEDHEPTASTDVHAAAGPRVLPGHRRPRLTVLGVAILLTIGGLGRALFGSRSGHISVPAAWSEQGGVAHGDLIVSEDGLDFVAKVQGVYHALKAPVGGLVAVTTTNSSGRDVEIVRPDGSRVEVASSQADEVVNGWSPDGRRVLYVRGQHAEEQGTYDRSLWTWSMDDGSSRRIGAFLVGTSNPVASWNRLGTSLAVVTETGREDGPNELVVTDATGAVLARIDRGNLGEVTWSPTGDHMAYTRVDRGVVNVWVSGADGLDQRALAESDAPQYAPVWVGSDHVAFVHYSATGNQFVVRAIGPASPMYIFRASRLRSLLEPSFVGVGDSADQVSSWLAAAADHVIDRSDPGWVNELEIVLDGHRLSPGEWFQPRLISRDPRGRPMLLPLRPEWSVSDNAPFGPVRHGWYRVTREGLGEIRATVGGGWDSTAARVRSVAPSRFAVPRVLHEDWHNGISEDAWIRFGDPSPTIVLEAGPDGEPAFLNNGDKNYASGALTRGSFDLSDGLTVEVEGKMPFSGGYYESWGLAVVGDSFPTGVPDSTWYPRGLVPGTVVNFHGRPPGTSDYLATGGLPALPDSFDTWRKYAIQVSPDGRSALLVDGWVFLRTRPSPDLAALPSARIALFGASHNAEILHGSVTIWRGERYRVR